MSVRSVLTVAAAALISGLVLAEPAAADPSVQTVVSVYTLSGGRIGASLAALAGLLGAVTGGLALVGGPVSKAYVSKAHVSKAHVSKAHVSTWAWRNGAVTALVAGLIAVVGGGFVAATADGGLGTGNGLGGAYVAMLMGLIAVALGCLARSRRTS